MTLQGIQPQLLDWLDDICVRFIINLPKEEFQSVERIIFQIEEGHWYYEDFIRPLDPTLPSLNLRNFCSLIFQHCPLLSQFSEYHAAAYAEFLAYKTRIPVRGAILLNDSMDQAVLVKGWKKGSSWGFPRGKINKDEKDLDCAIREVYEETGYEVREAGLIQNEDDAKYIDVTLREQQIRLYVFRGVPMDTHFEPRTRKEISKIQWYRLSELPGGRQTHEYEGPKNLFYMVAPFIAPLRAWVKLQKRNDRLRGVPAEPVALDDAGTDLEATHDEMIAADAPEVAERSQADTNHLQFLLSRLDQSKSEQNQDAPTINQSHATQLALELKKMLSVGSAAAATGPTPGLATLQVSPPPPPALGGSLMSLLRPDSTALPPRTPADQLDISPPQAQTPHHHNRKALQNMPPPQFLHPTQNELPHRFSFADTSNVYPQPPIAAQQFQQPPMPHQHQMFPPRQVGHVQHVPPQMPSSSIPFPAQHQVPPGPIGPHSTPLPPGFGAAPQNAPAPNMPPSKLNSHSLALLNTFKTSKISTEPVPVSPETKSLELPNDSIKKFGGNASSSARRTIPAGLIPNAGPGNSNAPRTTQQSALLGLFRNGQPMAAGLPASEVLVAELSAGTPKTLGKAASQAGVNEQHPQALGGKARQSNLTSATVSGPLNAPDFGAVQRARAPVELGDGQEIVHTPVPVHAIASGMVLEAPRPFHPSMILQRQQQYTPTDSTAQSQAKGQVQAQSHAHMPNAQPDHRGTHPTEQKSALLSLFNAKAPPVATGKLPVQGPQRRSSGNGSPVSPLPDGRVPFKQTEAPQVAAARSRVGSLAEDGRGGEVPITPVDKKFLFKYLEDMVNGK